MEREIHTGFHGHTETKYPLRRTRGTWKVKTKWILRIKMGWRGHHSSGSELLHVAGFCDTYDELGFYNTREFLDYLLHNNSAPCRQLLA